MATATTTVESDSASPTNKQKSALSWWLSPQTILQILFVNFGLFFQSTCVVFTQFYSLLIYPFSFKLYRQFISYTMRMWSQNLVALVQWFAPASVVMTFDKKSCGDLEDVVQKDTKSGDISKLLFPERIIVTANHQIYADWIYIWCIAHLAGAHGFVKIILKASLQNLPVYGLFFDFIFLKRKLALDKDNMTKNLERSKRNDQPMWLVLFPEGTVVSECTRKRSKEFAEKNNMKDNRYTLLPRSTGLRLCTTILDDSVEYMYDFTIGYSGVGPNDIPEKVYTIQSIFFFHHFPKQIHVHVRRFKIASIPKDNEEEFSQWVHERWVEKDELMGRFYKCGSFPKDEQEENQTVDIPVKLRDNSVLGLAHIWIFLVPYLLLIKQMLNYIQNVAA